MSVFYKNRTIFANIKQNLSDDRVLILVGPRQVGKTTLLQMLKEHLSATHPSAKSFLLDLEKPDILASFTDYRSIINFLQTQGLDETSKNYLFLDEFQHMPTPTKTLKILHDHYPYLKIIATGSSSLDIFSKLRQESLAGRKQIFNVFPLNFSEFLEIASNPEDLAVFLRITTQNLDPTPANSALMPLWETFAVWGGYPRAALTSANEQRLSIMSDLYQSYLERDVAGMLGAHNAASFIKVATMLAAQAGNLCNLTHVSKLAGITRAELAKYIFVLEHTFIIKLIKPFFSNKQKELTKMPKLYFVDTGLRNYLMRNFNALDARTDAGAVIENAVLMELIKHAPMLTDIFFWRTPQGAEVDFVLSSGNRVVPIEVKYQPFDRPTVPSGLKAFIDAYQPPTAYVLTKNYSSHLNWRGCAVTFLPSYLAEKIYTGVA